MCGNFFLLFMLKIVYFQLMSVNFYFTFYVKIEQINYEKFNGFCDVSVAVSRSFARLFVMICDCEATR